VGERLGVLGGTFDPPHVGHVIVAQDVLEGLDLDRLLLVPAGSPPHRREVFPASLRYELTRQLFAELDGMQVSEIELEREGPSYTVDTLERIRQELSPKALFCVIGSDQLDVIETWHDWRRLPALAQVAVMERAGQRLRPPEDAGIDYIRLEITRIDVSSTMIRQRLREGRPVCFLVPEVIRDRVEEAWRVYGTDPRDASQVAGDRPDGG
jgi:nicotinate-nucleotide adenylyltransferase